MSDNTSFSDEQRRQLADQLKRAREEVDEMQRRGRARIEELEKAIEGFSANKYKQALDRAIAEVDGTPEFNAWKHTIKGVRLFFTLADIEQFCDVEAHREFTHPLRADACAGLKPYYRQQQTIIHFELPNDHCVNLYYSRNTQSNSMFERFAGSSVYLRLDHPSFATIGIEHGDPDPHLREISNRVSGLDNAVKVHAWVANVYDLIFAVYKHAGMSIRPNIWRKLMRLVR